VLPSADNVIVMKDGEIIIQGQYDELKKKGFETLYILFIFFIYFYFFYFFIRIEFSDYILKEDNEEEKEKENNKKDSEKVKQEKSIEMFYIFIVLFKIKKGKKRSKEEKKKLEEEKKITDKELDKDKETAAKQV
jgi:ABC-type multidrug transport system ATPase subunit